MSELKPFLTIFGTGMHAPNMTNIHEQNPNKRSKLQRNTDELSTRSEPPNHKKGFKPVKATPNNSNR
jgi:hypothetical protein